MRSGHIAFSSHPATISYAGIVLCCDVAILRFVDRIRSISLRNISDHCTACLKALLLRLISIRWADPRIDPRAARGTAMISFLLFLFVIVVFVLFLLFGLVELVLQDAAAGLQLTQIFELLATHYMR
jgi:hypothetical protein